MALNGPDLWQHNPPGDDSYDRWLEEHEADLITEWLGVVDPWAIEQFQQFVNAKWESAQEVERDIHDDIGNDA